MSIQRIPYWPVGSLLWLIGRMTAILHNYISDSDVGPRRLSNMLPLLLRGGCCTEAWWYQVSSHRGIHAGVNNSCKICLLLHWLKYHLPLWVYQEQLPLEKCVVHIFYLTILMEVLILCICLPVAAVCLFFRVLTFPLSVTLTKHDKYWLMMMQKYA